MMKRQFTAQELRKWAASCRKAAIDRNVSGAEQEGLFKMEKALLDLAQQEDWLTGETVTVEFVYEESALKQSG